MVFSKRSNFDLIVVGAGPAGCSAAFTATKEGLSVLILEEHRQVGLPIQCAEGLSRSTIKGYLEIKPEWISAYLSGSIIRGPDGDEFKIDYPNVGWILDRERFDAGLAEIAVKEGALLKTNAKVIGVDDKKVIVKEGGGIKEYTYSFLIAADGISSNIGRYLGIDTRLKLSEIEVCAEYLLENIDIDPTRTLLIFNGEIAPGGYAWIFPKSNKSANIGLGISPLKTKRTAKSYLDNWIKREFPSGIIKRKIFGGVPAKILDELSGKNFFLVGDAARFTDPLSGAGIANGIKSGIIAGRNAFLRIKGKKDYFKKEIEKEILSEIRFHKRVRDAYLRLNRGDYLKIYRLGKKFFSGKTITDINTHHLVPEILISLPHLLPLGLRIFLKS